MKILFYYFSFKALFRCPKLLVLIKVNDRWNGFVLLTTLPLTEFREVNSYLPWIFKPFPDMFFSCSPDNIKLQNWKVNIFKVFFWDLSYFNIEITLFYRFCMWFTLGNMSQPNLMYIWNLDLKRVDLLWPQYILSPP